MQILIQNCTDHRFLANDQSWTSKWEDGRVFGSTSEALDVCLKTRLENVQIVMRFGKKDLDVHLPLRSSGCLN